MTEFHKTANFFTAFRKTYSFPYFYREQPLDWFSDVGMWGVGVAYITIALGLAVVIAFLGTRGYSRWRITLQMVISLAIGCSLVVCATGVHWQHCDYERVEDGYVLRYRINIGLTQANITLARMEPNSTEYSEYHNVKIGWKEVDQAEKEYRAALKSGWPVGILRLARYITANTGGMPYLRSFRWSGYAAKILLWVAFGTWVLSSFLVGTHVSYSATHLLFTGALQLLACIVYALQSAQDFYIPLDDGSPTPTKLRLRYAWMYWVSLFMGIFVILMAAIILVLDYLRPADMNKFFGTTSEFVSPYDEVLAQNQNKDIKGMIRNLSQKRPRNDRKQSQSSLGAGIDAERSRKAPFNRYGRTGADGTEFESLHEKEGVGRKKSTSLEVPDIHVEMVELPEEMVELPVDTEVKTDDVDNTESSDIQIDSESESERHIESGSDIADTSYETEDTVRSRSSSAINPSENGKHHVTVEND